mmetsp:Transcript_6126/g.20300  ORF Transcript_6126/g.20300 Transcript_6126/m.20300 type:complete len:268 (-) Transcript_6126:510-1313(-)
MEHRERVGWLVARDHVAGVVHTQKGEAVRRLERARLLAASHPRHRAGGRKVRAVRPWHGLCPGLVAEPVADVVLVPRVDEDAHSVAKLVGELLLVALHPVARELEAESDDVVAVGPLALTHAEGGTHFGAVEVGGDVGEVVAERRLLARLAHVVHVHAACLVRQQQRRVAHLDRDQARRGDGLARLDRCDARRRGRLHRSVRQVAHGGLVPVGRDDHVLVVLVLNLGSDEPVAHGRALEVDSDRAARQRLVVCPHLVRNSRHVVPRV